MIAGGVEWERGREGPEAALSEAPKERVGFQVKGGAFPVCLGPCFGEPGDVEASVSVVGYGVKGIGVSETDNCFRGGVSGDRKLCAPRQVRELMNAVGLAIVRRVASAVKR